MFSVNMMILRLEGMWKYYRNKSIKESTSCQKKSVIKERTIQYLSLEKALTKSILSCVDYDYISVKLIMSALNES